MMLKLIRRRSLVAMLAFATAAHFAAAPARSAEIRAIVEAIRKGSEYLKGVQKDGHWEVVPKPTGGEVFDVKAGQFSGRTALASWALLSAGVDEKDPSIAPAIKFLQANPTNGVYALGIRGQVWSSLSPSPAVKDAMSKDADLLLKGTKTWDESSTGFYGYTINEPAKENYDHSVSQFGVLGMWAAAQSGLNVPHQYWQMAALSWMSHQYTDGTWTYKYASPQPGGHDVSMTAAGLATLLIVQDQFGNVGSHGQVELNGLQGFGSKEVAAVNNKRLQSLWQVKAQQGEPVTFAIDTGMKWLGENFDQLKGTKDMYYTLFGISRVGAASGRRFFGSVDWYQRGADLILTNQHPDGSFNGGGDGDDAVPDTALALLFLERGLAPVMINKLHYEMAGKDGKPAAEAAHWNDRPRDANNVARWFGHSAEKFFNWQVVALENGTDELHDSPILYLSGDQPLNFSESDEQKLREFVEQGGLILGNAEEAKDAFSASFRKLGTKLFHQYEFRELPANHSIYTAQQFQRSHWKTKPEVLSLSNGVRELMILIPRADPAKAWQAQQVVEHAELHQLAADIYLYVSDKNNLRYRQPSYIVARDAGIPAGKPVSIARLFYSGNWDPEPGGWRRTAAVLHNQDHVELSVEPVQISSSTGDTSAPAKSAARLAMVRIPADHAVRPDVAPPAVLSNQPLAHLTGSVAFTFSANQRAALKKYVQDGGTLFIDAAGGTSAFKGSVDAEMNEIFGPDAQQLRAPLDLTKFADTAIVKELSSITKVSYRRGTETLIGKSAGLRLHGMTVAGRLAVIYSPEDVSTGMVGQPVDGVIGYSPETATQIAQALVRAVAPK